MTLSKGQCTRAGYTLNGWNTAADGSGTAYALGGTYAAEATATLYAQWTPHPPITYDANGGSGSIPSWSAPVGSTISLSVGEGFERPGYTINSWNTAADGSGIAYSLGSPYTVSSADTLYAQWRPAVIYHANGGQWHVIDGGSGFSVALQGDDSVVAWGNNTNGQTTSPNGLCGVIAVDAGAYHTVALRYDGTVVAWGCNDHGQTTVPSGLKGVVVVASGFNHTVALRNDGTVVAWGDNYYGQTTVPAGLGGVVAMAAGAYHTVALHGDGSVVAWGNNGYNQRTIPAGLHDVVAVAAGYSHTVALRSDGTVVAWGDNSYGQSTVPTGLTGVVSVVAGIYHTIALRSDGSVVAWGSNTYGQTTIPAGLTDVVAIAEGAYHTMALRDNGSVVAWGSINNLTASVPIGLRLLRQAKEPGVDLTLSHGQCTRPGFTLQGWNTAANGSGTAYALGDTYTADATVSLYAQWSPNPIITYDANGGSGSISPWFAPVGSTIPLSAGGGFQRPGYVLGGWNTAANGSGIAYSLSAIYSVSTGVTLYAQWHQAVVYNANGGLWHVIDGGAAHTVALRGDGSVITWGNSDSGQTLTPEGLSDVVAITAGSYHTVALRDNGTLVGWGFNTYGQSTVPADLNSAVSVAAGYSHTAALRSDGTVVAWGDNTYGQTIVPAGLAGVVAVAAGGSHTVALRGDGTVVAWGYNYYGQATVPDGLLDVIAVTAGDSHTMALRGDGTVVAWGSNNYGQTTVPAGLSDVIAIAAGPYHSVALRVDGSVVAWGNNSYGESAVPTGLNGVVAVAAGGPHTLALHGDGSVVAWGNNLDNQSTVPTGLNLLRQGKAPGVDLTLSHGQCTRSGYTLQSWNTAPDGSGTTYALGGTYSTDAAVTLYAQWAPHLVITYDANGGSGSILSWTTPVGSTISLSVGGGLQRTGHVISGWNSAADGTGFAYSLGAPYTVLTAVTLYAQWQPAVIYHANGGQWHVIEGGPECTLALRSDDSVVAWGSSGNGLATVPSGLGDIVAVAAGPYHIVALRDNGTVVAWGDNNYDQTTVPAQLTGVTDVAAGYAHTVALCYDGTVVAWGYNSYGQTTVPDGLTNVVAIAAGRLQTVALRSDGTVVAWGNNDWGQTTVPDALVNVASVAAGYIHTVALRSDGTVVAWGDNSHGNQTTVPDGLTNVVAVAAGAYHTVALRSDGSVVTWGDNTYGQTTVPAGLTDVVTVTAGDYHTVALRSDGSVVAWGKNFYGQTRVPIGLSLIRQGKAPGVDLTLSHGQCTRSGYTLYGWNTVLDGSGTAYALGGTYTANAAVTLYAQWATVIYQENGGTGTIAPASKSHGIDLMLSDGTGFSRVGATFAAWNTKADGSGTLYPPGSTYSADIAITLYAQWTPDPYPVTYLSNGGTGTIATAIKSYGIDLTLSDGTGFSRVGATFTGWNTQADGSGTNYVSGGAYTADIAVTLYAQWTPSTYVVTYLSNGGTGTIAAAIKAYGIDLTLSDGTGFSRVGATFTGWNTQADGSGTNYVSGGAYTANIAVTLYAVWNDTGSNGKSGGGSSGNNCGLGAGALALLFVIVGLPLRKRRRCHERA